jgi:hypothetical protein
MPPSTCRAAESLHSPVPFMARPYHSFLLESTYFCGFAGNGSPLASDYRASGACMLADVTPGFCKTGRDHELMGQCSEETIGGEAGALLLASSTSEGLAKDVVITQSVQLEEVSERDNCNTRHTMSPSTPSSFKAPHTCPAALQAGNRSSALSPRLQTGESWLPLLNGQTFASHTPSPTRGLAFPRSTNFPSSSPMSKWRKVAQLTTKVCVILLCMLCA